MQRFIAYNEGMSIVNVSSAEGGYNYYAFQRWGSPEWCIIKEKIDGTEYLYLIGNKDYTNAWTNHATITFKTPSNWNV